MLSRFLSFSKSAEREHLLKNSRSNHQKETGNFFETVPVEILKLIISQLDNVSKAKLGMVNKRFHKIFMETSCEVVMTHPDGKQEIKSKTYEEISGILNKMQSKKNKISHLSKNYPKYRNVNTERVGVAAGAIGGCTGGAGGYAMSSLLGANLCAMVSSTIAGACLVGWAAGSGTRWYIEKKKRESASDDHKAAKLRVELATAPEQILMIR